MGSQEFEGGMHCVLEYLNVITNSLITDPAAWGAKFQAQSPRTQIAAELGPENDSNADRPCLPLLQGIVHLPELPERLRQRLTMCAPTSR